MRHWTDARLLIAALAIAPMCMSAPAQAQALRKIYVKNDCNRPVQFFVHHADKANQWHPHGWYKLSPNQGTRLATSGVTLNQLEDHNLYFYAETTDGGSASRWQGGGPNVEMQGGTYRTMKANSYTDSDGDFSIRLTCN